MAFGFSRGSYTINPSTQATNAQTRTPNTARLSVASGVVNRSQDVLNDQSQPETPSSTSKLRSTATQKKVLKQFKKKLVSENTVDETTISLINQATSPIHIKSLITNSQKQGVIPSIKVLHSTLERYAELNQVRLAHYLYNSIPHEHRDSICKNIMVQVLHTENKIQETIDMFFSIPSHERSTRSKNTMIKIYSGKMEINNALMIFQSIPERERLISSYNLMIDALAFNDRSDDAIRLFEQNAIHKKNNFTINLMIRIYAKSGYLKTAEDWYKNLSTSQTDEETKKTMQLAYHKHFKEQQVTIL